MKNIQALAETLAELARAAGYVVTITQESLRPLAMGNHVDRVTVWPARVTAATAPQAASQQGEAINRIADDLEDEAQPYDGEFADVVRSSAEALRELVQGGSAPQAATTARASGGPVGTAHPQTLGDLVELSSAELDAIRKSIAP